MGESCETIQDLLPQFVAETMESSHKFSLFEHLRRCSDCRHELAYWVTVGRSAAEQLSPSPPQSVLDGVWHELQKQIRPATREPRHVSPTLLGTMRQCLTAPVGIVGTVVDVVLGHCTRPLMDTVASTSTVLRETLIRSQAVQ